MPEEILRQNIPRVSKLSSVPNQEETTMCSFIIRPNCAVCKKTKSTRARCRRKPQKHVDGIAPSTKFADLITADHKILNAENESRCGHKNGLIVQDDFTKWIQSYPMKTKETSETMLCLQIFLPPSQKQERVYIENFKEFLEACQDLQWNRGASTLRSEMNGVAERTVFQKNAGTVR